MRSAPRGRSLAGELGRVFRLRAEAHRGKAWPSEKWANDPVGFADKILGVRLWSWQIEMLESIRDNRRTAVSGGRKIGKDFVVAVAALWWFATRDDARVFITAATLSQIETILYRQIRMMWGDSARCVACKTEDAKKVLRRQQPGPRPCPHSAVLTGEVGKLVHTGIVASDLREIKGKTAEKPENLSGLSGQNILAIIDEASVYPDELFKIIQGNLAAAGCRLVLISNPTSQNGFFYEIFHIHHYADPKSPAYYKLFRVPSTAGPNYTENRTVFPGLADRDWVRSMAVQWRGENSPSFRMHVMAEFCKVAEGAIFFGGTLAQSAARWNDTPPTGPTTIGVDPAGESGLGDDSAFVVVRGKRMLDAELGRGLTPDGHVMKVLGLLMRPELRGEGIPRVVVDSDGEIGSLVYPAFRSYASENPSTFELIRWRGSDKATRWPDHFERRRDELMRNLQDWIGGDDGRGKNGGAIVPPPDGDGNGSDHHFRLVLELEAMRYVENAQRGGRSKLIGKDKLRAVLGHSPDIADALALAVWPREQMTDEQVPAVVPLRQTYTQTAEEVFDPYEDQNGAGGMDAYDALAQLQRGR